MLRPLSTIALLLLVLSPSSDIWAADPIGSAWIQNLRQQWLPDDGQRVHIWGDHDGPRVTAYGRVTDERDQPLSGVLVVLRENSRGQSSGQPWRDVLATTTTDDAGKFEFRDVPTPPHANDWFGSRPRWDVVAIAAGRGVCCEHLTRVAMDRPFQMQMPPAATVAGTVVNDQGMPVANAILGVVAVWRSDLPADEHPNLPGVLKIIQGQVKVTATTDAEGRFQLAGLPPDSRFAIWLHADDHRHAIHLVTTSAKPVPPVKGKEVLHGPLRIVMQAYDAAARQREVARRAAARKRQEQARIADRRTVIVRVVDAETKKPLAVSDVVLTSRKERGYGLSGWPSPGVGLFRIETTETIFGLEAVGPVKGYFVPGAGITTHVDTAGPYISVALQPDEQQKEVLFPIHRGLTIEGIVRDRKGEPLVGATVGLSRSAHLALRRGQSSYNTTTNARGEFVIRGLDPYNANYLLAVHPQQRLKRRFIVTPPAGDAPTKTSRVEVTAYPTATIRGRLIRGGKPLLNPDEVSLSGNVIIEGKPHALGFDRFEVDKEGQFEFPLVEALPMSAGEIEYTLDVRCYDRSFNTVEFSAEPGEVVDLPPIEFVE